MRKLGLIGKNLDHSWSMDYFREKFRELNLQDYMYENFPLPSLSAFAEFIAKEKDLLGLNITVPYKKDIIGLLDYTDPIAQEIGAVNCIKIVRDTDSITLKGYNTDMPAFRDTLIPLISEQNTKALVLGTGGASLAVCHAFTQLGIPYHIVSRSGAEGSISYTEVTPGVIAEVTIIINATPAGMYPHIDGFPPLPYSCLTPKHLLYDLVYNPEETIFLKKGREYGSHTKNGLEMLQRQGDLSWEIWNQ